MTAQPSIRRAPVAPPPVRGLGTEDGWLLAAAALRHAALDGHGIAGLSASARFQTRGRGPAVVGVALTAGPGQGVRAEVGLVLTVAALSERLRGTLRAAEQRLRAAWAHFPEAPPLDLRLHVVDIADSEEVKL